MDDLNKTMTIDEVEQYLDQVVDTFPSALFEHLNGGVVISQALVHSPHGGNLYILGTYHYEPYGMGRYIEINYGSFVRLFAGKPRAEQEQALHDLLRHELTHHIESLAGVRDLEIKDEIFIENHKKNQDK